MRKKLKQLVATVLFGGMMLGTFSMAGCGSNTVDEKISAEPTRSAVLSEGTETMDTVSAAEPTTTPESKKVEPILYERLDAWDDFYKEYNCYYSAIQIEDMFLHPGMLGSELAEVVAAGKDTAIIPVSVDKLIDPDKSGYSRDIQKVTYYRDETPWFDVYVRNYSKDLLPFGECIVSLIVPSEGAMEYCRFFDGTYSLSSIKEISYKDYDKFAIALENIGYTIEKDGSIWNVSSTDEFCPASLSEKVLYWTCQKLFTEMKIDADTGNVATVDISGGAGECVLYTKTIPDDFNWGEEGVAEQLVQLLYADEYCNPESEEIIETVCVYSGNEEHDYIMLYRIQYDDEQVRYAVYNKSDVRLNFRNEIVELPKEWEGYGTGFWKIEGSCTDAYMKINELNPDGELIYEYKEECKGLVKEDFEIYLRGNVLTLPATPDEVLEFFSAKGVCYLAGRSDSVLEANEKDFAFVRLKGIGTVIAQVYVENSNDYTCDIMEGTVTSVIVDSDEGCVFPLGYRQGDSFDLEKAIQMIGEYNSIYNSEKYGSMPTYTQYTWYYESGIGDGWNYGVSVNDETGEIMYVQIGYWKN